MENIIGHENVKIILNKIISEDKVGHAYLFSGKEGIGKKLMAMEFARMVMNNAYQDLDSKDFMMIRPEKDVIKIEEIRNLISEVYIKPVYSKRKVIIIDDADKMNINAQNALLKVLEEPPLYITLILITSNKERIISTILSRVTEIVFNELTNDELSKIVGNKIDLSFARGSASKALEIMEGECFSIAKELFDIINKKDFLMLNRKLTEIKKQEIDFIKVLDILKLMFFKDLKEATYLKVKVIDILENTIKYLNRNSNLDLTLDKFMIEICNV